MQRTNAVAQMNIRMSRDLKMAGDSVLAEVGITPTELIRELWEKISRGAADAMQVQELLQGRVANNTGTVESTAKTQKVAALARGRCLFEEGLDTLGVQMMDPSYTTDSTRSDIDTYAEAMMERMHERGTW